jgi:LPXTG-site transpeptidase (sortase) family protein
VDPQPPIDRFRAQLSRFYHRPLWRDWTPRRLWPFALIVVGAILVGYVGSQYGDMAWQQHRLAQRWAEQNAARATTTTTTTTTPAPVDDGLIRLTIPKIDLDDMVVEGTSRKQLLIGPGHMEDTALPGESGNAVITAHRDTFFRHIYELNKGDQIEVRRAGQVFHFEVTGKKVIQPTDVHVTDPTPDARLTLITCYPTYYIGPAPERLVVFAKLVDHGPDNNSTAETKTSPTPGATQ